MDPRDAFLERATLGALHLPRHRAAGGVALSWSPNRSLDAGRGMAAGGRNPGSDRASRGSTARAAGRAGARFAALSRRRGRVPGLRSRPHHRTAAERTRRHARHPRCGRDDRRCARHSRQRVRPLPRGRQRRGAGKCISGAAAAAVRRRARADRQPNRAPRRHAPARAAHAGRRQPRRATFSRPSSRAAKS